MSLEEFDAFTTLKALREMKKQLDAKQSQQGGKQKPILQYIQKQQPLSMYDLRSQFQHWLSKINELSTRQIAYQNIFNLVTNNQSQQALQIYLNCLQTPLYQKGSDSVIKTINIIVNIFGEQINVQDLYKLLSMVLKHFNDQSHIVQQACCECWVSFYLKNACKLNLQQRILLLYQTLSNLIGTGSNRQSQETATMVISQLFEILNNTKDITFLKDVIKDFTQLYLKQQIDHSSIYTSMFYMVKGLTIQSFTNNQIHIIDKALQTINNQKMNYRTRIGACNLLKLIATQYQNSNFKIILGDLHEQVIIILDESTKDRVIAVQNGARDALKEWMKLKLQIDTIANIQQDIDLQQSNAFLKKNTGTGGGYVQLNKFKQQQQQQQQQYKNKDIKQQIQQIDFDKTIDYNNFQYDDTISIWEKALQLDQSGLSNDAVQLLLNNGDDLYLLRFLMQYNDHKKLFDKLNTSLAQQLVDTLIIILESDFLNHLCLDFVQNYIDFGLKDWFKDSEFQDYLKYFSDTNQEYKSLLEQFK